MHCAARGECDGACTSRNCPCILRAHILPVKTSTLPFLGVFAAISLAAVAEQTIEVRGKHEKEFSKRQVRTLADLPAVPADAGLDEFGGLPGAGVKAAGFFRTQKIGERWWLVDPKGGLFVSKGVVSVAPGKTKGAKAEIEHQFGDTSGWAEQTTATLRNNGFNSLGSWSENEPLRAVPHPVVQTKLWSFMSSYGKKRGGTHMEAGHTGYTNDAIFVFDPDFAKFCDEHAKQLEATKNDPWLLGHYSDNELPLKRTILKGFLTLPENEPGYRAAWEWFRKRHGALAKVEQISEQDQKDFLAFVADRYFSIVSRAIRKHDPNHLFLGARFHSAVYDFPELFKASGPYVDVVSVNYYFAWTPEPAKMAMWTAQSGKPVIITEWYAKGEDSGMGNTGGAGWLVHTQKDRGLYYQHFALGLLAQPTCVGWHWFRYADNDPDDKAVDPSNRDSNKGIVTFRYKPWTELLEAMKPLNDRAYGLIRHFDPHKP